MSVLLSTRGLTKSYGVRPLFADLAVDLAAGERIGLIGPNGAGKSTLLKILALKEEADAGERTLRRGIRVGYLGQDDTFAEGQTALDVVVAGMATDNLEPHEAETRAVITLTQVGFLNPEQPAAVLSGGWRKRLSLARELARKPDLLLLDEPTNHLDLPGVVWLEKLLRGSPFGYLVATHDRAFLRAVADDILEISRVYPGGAFRATGGYDSFADKRDVFLQGQEQQRESVANRVRVETDWLAHKARARTRKASSRIEAAADRRAELAELNYRTGETRAAGIDFVSSGRKTRKLLTATGITKALGGRTLFKNIDLMLSPGMKLGLLGPNGSGKSTILKLLSGDIQPDSGTVERAEGLRIVTFEQGRASLDLKMSLRKALCPNGETVKVGDQQLHVNAWARRFLFDPAILDLELSALSGGEQARVRIAQMMVTPADLLLLDEPTNDLDIPSLEVLEDSLSEFAGAAVIVSHDRDLLDRLCTEVIGLDGRGGSANYGSVDQWLTAYDRATKEVEKVAKAATKATPVKVKKLSFREEQELEGMEAALMAGEDDVTAKSAAVEDAAVKGREALAAACKALENAQRHVEGLYARWQELEARNQ